MCSSLLSRGSEELLIVLGHNLGRISRGRLNEACRQARDTGRNCQGIPAARLCRVWGSRSARGSDGRAVRPTAGMAHAGTFSRSVRCSELIARTKFNGTGHLSWRDSGWIRGNAYGRSVFYYARRFVGGGNGRTVAGAFVGVRDFVDVTGPGFKSGSPRIHSCRNRGTQRYKRRRSDCYCWGGLAFFLFSENWGSAFRQRVRATGDSTRGSGGEATLA